MTLIANSTRASSCCSQSPRSHRRRGRLRAAPEAGGRSTIACRRKDQPGRFGLLAEIQPTPTAASDELQQRPSSRRRGDRFGWRRHSRRSRPRQARYSSLPRHNVIVLAPTRRSSKLRATVAIAQQQSSRAPWPGRLVYQAVGAASLAEARFRVRGASGNDHHSRGSQQRRWRARHDSLRGTRSPTSIA